MPLCRSLATRPFHLLLPAVMLVVAVALAPKANAQPSAAPPAAPNPVPPAATLFERLSQATTVDQLKLTDEQRLKLSNTLTERTEALAKAAPAERLKLSDQYEEKLAALLSEEQRTELAKAVAGQPGTEPKLKFTFRFQRWGDVLDWFAQQAGLSLVLDAPPPGTFNYSDSREYSVADALDLLNGVLLTKGFTLVRREQMLLVIDLADGLPESLVPRVDVAELDRRGKFEFVSMLFQVGNRNVDEVVKEVTPLLGPRGKSQALPKTSQVLITDTAGVMRAIKAVIESIPQPEKKAESPAPKPELVVYPLKSADPDAAVKVLEALMPGARFVRDPKANQISAYAIPAEQAAAKQVIEQMQTTDGPADQQARFEVYQIDQTDPRQTLATLQPLVPGARISVDPISKKVAAWGTPADHELLKKAVAQLASETDTDDRQVEVYRLNKAEPTAALTLLQNIVPRAKIAIDAPTRSIVALATVDEQKTIRATLDQLEPGERDPNRVELRFYPFEQAPPAGLTTVLQSMAPKAQVTIDTSGRRLSVVATAADHSVVKETFDRFTQAAGKEEKRQLVLYPVSPAERKRFQLMLADLTADFPTVKVLADAEPGELAVWAKPAEHEVIADIIEKLKQQTPPEEAYRLAAYPIVAADPTSVMSVLTSMFPSTKLVLDLKGRRLVAWTRPAEQASIKSLIEQMDGDAPADSKNQLMVYPISGADPTAAMSSLKNVVPDAMLVSDIKAGTISAWARKSDQELIAKSLESLQGGDDPKRRPHVVAYEVGAADPVTISPLITTLVPTARVVPNAKSGTVAVWALPEDHETIRGAIAELTGKKSDAGAAKVVVYTLKHVNAAGILGALTTAVPEARLNVGQSPRKLVAWARPADQATIESALKELDLDDAEVNDAVVRTYPIKAAEPSNLVATLQALLAARRDVRLSLDTVRNKLVVLAPLAQQDAIREVIEEVERGSSLETDAKLEVHPLRNADPDTTLQVLNNLVAKQYRVVLSIDPKSRQLIAVAPEAQQETIRATIERLQTAQRQLEVFQLDVVEPAMAKLSIERLFADSGGRTAGTPIIESDSISQRLFVRGNQDQIGQIRELLVKMGETNLGTGHGGTVRVIPFSGDTRAALDEIQRVWPQLSKSPLRILGARELTPSAPPRPPAGVEPDDRFKPLPDKKTPAAKEPAAPALDKQTYNCRSAARTVEVRTASQEAAAPQASEPPAAQPAVDQPPVEAKPEPRPAPKDPNAPPDPIVVAPGEDKITIMSDDPEAVEQFEALLRSLAQSGRTGRREIFVYPLRSASSTTVAELLTRMFRETGFRDVPVTVEADQRLNAVIVAAGRNDRAAIERLLKQLDSEDIPETLVANRPTLIPVRNTSAVRIETVLQSVYKTQLTSGGIKRQIPIPSGASLQVAAVIQQVNTAAAGPLMTLGVDDTTNSVVVMAPAPLVREVRDLVAELDEAAVNDTSRGVRIVKLKSTSALRVKEILDTLIKDAARRKSSGR